MSNIDSFSVNIYPTMDNSPICRICHCGEGDSDSLYKGSNYSSTTVTTTTTNGKPGSPIPFSLTTPNNITTTTTTGSTVSTPECSSLSNANEMSLITPCCCSGSLRYVHHYCLQQWIRSSNNKYCELCKYHFKMSVKYKPLHKWERLEMSNSERRKLLYNLLFNLISMFCVFWSIYVLIERATFEAKYGLLDWPFWTKMLVVSIGFLGGTIFLFVQLRLYLSIFMRWRQYNRIIIIHSVNCDNNSSSTAATATVPKIEKKPSFELDLSGIK